MEQQHNYEKKTFLYLQLLLLVYSFGGVFSKLASSYDFLSIRYVICYGLVLLILFVYAIGWQQIIKRMPLITAYASKAVTIIWGIVWGAILFKEKITIPNVIGAIVIVIGIFLVILEEK